MIYQITITTTKAGYGFCRYTSNKETAEKIRQSYQFKLPDSQIIIREVKYPTQDQIYQANDVDINWGIK